MNIKFQFVLCGLAGLCSCHEDSQPVAVSKLPVSETHYRLDTGIKLGEKLFKYNQAGSITQEAYTDARFSSTNTLLTNEYDAENHLTRTTFKFTEEESRYTTDYLYENDKLVRQFSSQNGAENYERRNYFYSNQSQPDSMQLFYNALMKGDFVYESSLRWNYDQQGRLIQERLWASKDYDFITKINHYEGDLLMSTCNPVSGLQNIENCIRNEYNSQGQLLRVFSTMTGTADKLLEDYTYKDGIRIEKRIYDQADGLPTYTPDPTRYTVLVKYQY